MPTDTPVEFPLRDDIAYLRAALPQLEDYLISNQPAWKVDLSEKDRRAAVPLMSPGTLLLACARICLKRLPEQNAAERTSLLERRKEVCHRWTSAWRGKVLNDFHTYTFLWKNLLQDYRFERDQLAYYPFEVHQRVVLDLMIEDTPEILVEETRMLEPLDDLLKETLPEGDFLWEESLMACFPLPRFWYLYRRV